MRAKKLIQPIKPTQPKMETKQEEQKKLSQPLNEPWFGHIRDGAKVVEGRLNKSWVRDLKPGVLIEFTKVNPDPDDSTKQTITVEVTDVLHELDGKKLTFEKLFDHAGLENVLPGIETYNDGLAVYRQWYSADKEKECGVIGIYVKMLS